MVILSVVHIYVYIYTYIRVYFHTVGPHYGCLQLYFCFVLILLALFLMFVVVTVLGCNVVYCVQRQK